MKIVRECIDVFPFDTPPYVIERREELLFADPLPLPMKRLREHAPIEVVHLGASYVEQAFAPPRGVYESPDIRIEWQNMHGRQPFYHRNCGVDELSFQVCGERTLMTELGSVELRPGDFSRIPDGVAHDNFGRRDVHLLFYVPSPVEELGVASLSSDYKTEPFPGWKANIINELTTEGVGGPGQDLGLTPVDEALLLQQAQSNSARIQVMRPDDARGLRWLYRSASLAIGRVSADASMGDLYTRHRNAIEIQYQVEGTRTLVTQRGCVTLEPGDFVCMPRGIAFTSIHATFSTHIAIASTSSIPQIAAGVRQGVKYSVEALASLRSN
jgi:uncharacterized cupin superfamily protein